LFLLIVGLAVQVAHGQTTDGMEMAAAPPAPAEASTVSPAMFATNNVWMMVSTFLVFIMHLGFASVESGLTRAKNTVNILFKNTAIPAIGLLTFAVIGFNLMYPGGDYAGKWFGFSGFWIFPPDGGETVAYAGGNYTYWTDFLFQGMFAATAATIVSGAVAERVKLSSFLIFTTIYVAICYPMVGMWHWGGGWLQADWMVDKFGGKFHDFAGSTIVHSVGGWGALIGAWMLGPRKGKYVNGKSKPMFGHSMPLAVIGVFMLWLGWFGFNGGSVLSAAPGDTSRVLVTTCLAAAAGLLAAMLTSWKIQEKPDLSMILNGCLAGLVGITAGADVTTPAAATFIGASSGVLVVLAVLFIDQVLKIDDPVGAISVHLVCGVWGTFTAGWLGEGQAIMPQLIGIVSIGIFCLVFAFVTFAVIRAVMGLRVSEDEELRGLDLGEHGMEAYAGFQIFSTQ